ncbi:MAG: EamA family transporter [Candidatus Niyogibacteria bacterium]|nr:EamA family transporter [Candidatus Niyogibacteria bacterium]
MGFILAFLTAIAESTTNVLSKKALINKSEYSMAWTLRFFSLPFLLLMLALTEKSALQIINEKFWLALLISGGLNSLTTVLSMKAIKYSDLSVTVPMLAFSPAFLLITSPVILGETPTIIGVVGILLIVLGSYILNLQEKKNGYLEPFKALLKEKGSRLMLLVAFIWSITSNFDKIGVQNSSPILWATAVNIFIVIVLLPILWWINSPANQIKIFKDTKTLFLIGFFGALVSIFQMTAVNLILVSYVIAIKRLSIIFTTIAGYLFFKEQKLRERLAGAIIMLIGVVLIIWRGI